VGLSLIALLGTIAFRTISPWLGNDSWGHYAGGGMFATDAPSLSPDGESVAFSSPATGHGDIYVKPLSGSEAERVTSSKLCDLSPRFCGARRLVFEREAPPYCHIWTIDLDTRVECQLTTGHVTDKVFDVAPGGDYALIWRGDFWKQGGPCLLDLHTGQTRKVPLFVYALFINRGTCIIGREDQDTDALTVIPLEGMPKQRLARGYLQDCNDATKMIVFSPSREDGPNWNLACLLPGEQEPVPIGAGHSTVMFDNGKILFFSGFEHQAWIWDNETKTSHQIESPSGYKYRPHRGSDGNTAALYVMHPVPLESNNDRELHIYLFDATREDFTEVPVTPPVK